MGKTINYIGNVSFSINDNSFLFQKVKIEISVEPIASAVKNIFDFNVILKKGYRISTKCNIFLVLESEKQILSGFLTSLNVLSKDKLLTMYIFGTVQRSYPINTFVFDTLDSEINYNKYINDNFNLGFELELEFKYGKLLNSFPAFWGDTSYNPNILSASILLSDFVI